MVQARLLTWHRHNLSVSCRALTHFNVKTLSNSLLLNYVIGKGRILLHFFQLELRSATPLTLMPGSLTVSWSTVMIPWWTLASPRSVPTKSLDSDWHQSSASKPNPISASWSNWKPQDSSPSMVWWVWGMNKWKNPFLKATKPFWSNPSIQYNAWIGMYIITTALR